MGMKEWAEREIELACKNACNDDSDSIMGEYTRACCKSALKAYESLLEDGHSGYSIKVTQDILNRLINRKPLTRIEDTEDVWDECVLRLSKADKRYQCSRMSSLFKDVYSDGTVKYTDINRVVCHDADNPHLSYHSGFIRDIIDDMYPIEMPYYPKDPFHVYCEDFLTDPKHVDFDTKAILFITTPDGTHVDIKRYFKEEDNKWVEISLEEFHDRRLKQIKSFN